MRGYPCMCGGCARCLRDQGVYECPGCGAFGGCDCESEPEAELAKVREYARRLESRLTKGEP